MEIPLFQDIVVIFLSSVFVVYFFSMLKLPPIIGYLIVGAIIGPHAFGLIEHEHEVEYMAEIGVIFLLFTIGMEFSAENFARIRNTILGGGTLQVGLTILATAGVFAWMGFTLPQATFIGFLIALSSTAIVFKLLMERGEMDSPQGHTIVAVLIFQDLVIVPMMLLTPMLSGQVDNVAVELIMTLVKALVIVGGVIIAGKYLIDPALYLITKTRNKELFYMTVIALCFSITWLTSVAGLSLGLGAFMAGLMLSRSEYSHFALTGVMPFKDIFTSFFFVSVGMLLNMHNLIANPLLILGAVALVLVVKTIIATGAVFVLGYTMKSSLIAGLSLSQVGEFSFILSRVGVEQNLISMDDYQLFLSVSIITMILTPFLMQLAPIVAERMHAMPLPDRIRYGLYGKPLLNENEDGHHLKDHLVIVGFGINGRNLSRAARCANIPYIVIEMNSETVKAERAQGEPIFYGDSSFPEILNHANIKRARTLVVTVADPAATQRTIHQAREMNPNLHIIARTRFLSQMEALHRAGANEVVPEEFETSIEIFIRVMSHYLVPKDEIEEFVHEIRAQGYQMLRNEQPDGLEKRDLKKWISDVEVVSLRVESGSPISGKSIGELGIRRRFGVTVLAVQREGQTHTNPEADWRFKDLDVLICMGRFENLHEIERLHKATDKKDETINSNYII